MDTALNKLKTPADTLPPLLLYATAIQRSGISPSRASSDAITKNGALGISTGVNPDGSPNVVNEYTNNIISAVLDEIMENGVVQISIPPGAITVQAEGGNAGGPVVCVGQNITNTIVKGIIR